MHVCVSFLKKALEGEITPRFLACTVAHLHLNGDIMVPAFEIFLTIKKNSHLTLSSEKGTKLP